MVVERRMTEDLYLLIGNVRNLLSLFGKLQNKEILESTLVSIRWKGYECFLRQYFYT